MNNTHDRGHGPKRLMKSDFLVDLDHESLLILDFHFFNNLYNFFLEIKMMD